WKPFSRHSFATCDVEHNRPVTAASSRFGRQLVSFRVLSMTRVRFAPSPTGYLHIGGARTFIFNWLHARHQGGAVVLRIDDTDVERNTQISLDSIYEGLRWLELGWDEFYRQSDGLDLHLGCQPPPEAHRHNNCGIGV